MEPQQVATMDVVEKKTKKIPPPRPYTVWDLGGVSPVEGQGLTYDRYPWYFRAQGKIWRMGIGVVRARRNVSVGSSWDGDGYDVVMSFAEGWYQQGEWPSPLDRQWDHLALAHPDPASYMPRSAAAALISEVMRGHDARNLDPRVKPRDRPRVELSRWTEGWRNKI